MPARSHHHIAPAVAALGLSLTLGACSSPGSAASGTGAATSVAVITHLDVAGFAGLVAVPSTVLIDVRTPAEFAAGHLQGARNLDIRAADFDAQLATLDKGAAYAMYCHSGNRSGQAVQRMAAAGFTHVADLSGGITAWTSAGHPVTTD